MDLVSDEIPETSENVENKLRVDPTDEPRLQNVKRSLQYSIERILSTWKPTTFTRGFPSLASKNETILEAVRQAVLQSAHTDLYTAASEIVNTELKEPLDRLSLLIADCPTPVGTPTWRPTGQPDVDMTARDVQILQYEKTKLENNLESHKSKTAELKEQVLEVRYKVQENGRTLTERSQKCEQFAEQCRALADEESTPLQVEWRDYVLYDE